MKYCGVDWLLAILGLLSIYLTAHKKPSGFLVGAAAALVGIGFSYMIASWANSICSLAIMLFNLWAWRKWHERV